MSDENKNRNLPELGNKNADGIASSGRALLNLIPVAGPLLAEIFTDIIPYQRIDRVEEYLRQLRARIETLEVNKKERIKEPESAAMR